MSWNSECHVLAIIIFIIRTHYFANVNITMNMCMIDGGKTSFILYVNEDQIDHIIDEFVNHIIFGWESCCRSGAVIII